MQQARNISHHGGNLLTLCQGLIEHPLVINRVGLEIMLQCEVVVLHDLAQPLGKVCRVQQLAETQATA